MSVAQSVAGETKPMIASQDVQVEWLENLTKKKEKQDPSKRISLDSPRRNSSIEFSENTREYKSASTPEGKPRQCRRRGIVDRYASNAQIDPPVL